MSKGPGKWQRYLLELVERLGADERAVSLRSLTTESTSSAEYKALYRAARRLDDDGRLKLVRLARERSQVFVFSVLGYERYRREKGRRWRAKRHELGKDAAWLLHAGQAAPDLIVYESAPAGRRRW